jgi:outer membrane protein TolC
MTLGHHPWTRHPWTRWSSRGCTIVPSWPQRRKSSRPPCSASRRRDCPLGHSLAFGYAGGGFGGGQNAFFGNFSGRGDATVSLFWELQNLGFTDRAIARRNEAENHAAALRLIKVENQVAAEVAAAYKTRLAAARRMAQTALEVTKAQESLRLNLLNIRRGAGLPEAIRPIEVLQPIQALALARTEYLNSVRAYNRAQFRLYYAIGWPALVPTRAVPSGY